MRNKATITELANLLGLSTSTISQILNKKENLNFSEETIKRVQNTAERMGYDICPRNEVPLKIAVSIREEYYDILPTLSNRCNQLNIEMVVLSKNSTIDEHLISGLLFFGKETDFCCKNLINQIPIVAICDKKIAEIDSIIIDLNNSTRVLKDKGFTKIAYVHSYPYEIKKSDIDCFDLNKIDNFSVLKNYETVIAADLKTATIIKNSVKNLIVDNEEGEILNLPYFNYFKKDAAILAVNQLELKIRRWKGKKSVETIFRTMLFSFINKEKLTYPF